MTDSVQPSTPVAAVASVRPVRSGASRALRSQGPYWAILSPLLIILAMFYFAPILEVLWLSFSDPELGFGNYERIVTSDAVLRVFGTTARICAATTVLAVLIGYLIAYAMMHVGPRHRTWMLAFVLIPFWISVLVRAFAWLVLLRTDGPLNGLLMSLGIVSEPLHLVRNELGVVIGMTHYMIPYAVLPILANLQGIDSRLVLAARGLGASARKSFYRVYLPLSAPGIAGAGILVFIFSLGFFVTPAILGGGKTVMVAEFVSIQIMQIAKWGVGAMIATVLLATVVLMLVVVGRFINLKEMLGAR